MGAPQVIWLGKDWYKLGYVESMPDIIESKGFGRGKLTPTDFTLSLRNNDNTFSVDNPKSFLYGFKWQYSNIKVYDSDEILILDGIVKDVSRNHRNKTVQVQCKDKIFQNRKTSIEYESDDWETPISVSKNIMDVEGLEYDSTSVIASINQLKSDGCYVKVNINKSDNLSVFQAVQKMGIYGCSDTYMHLNKVYQQFWQPYSGGVSVTFDYGIKKDCPRTTPIVSTLESSMYNDYSIGYFGDGGVPATDSNSNKIAKASRNPDRYGTQQLPEMRAGDSNKQIYFKDKNSAIVIGEAYIRRGHFTLSIDPKILQTFLFDVSYSYRKQIQVGTYFRMTFADEGWVSKVWEVAGIKKNLDKQDINITAWETVT